MGKLQVNLQVLGKLHFDLITVNQRATHRKLLRVLTSKAEDYCLKLVCFYIQFGSRLLWIVQSIQWSKRKLRSVVMTIFQIESETILISPAEYNLSETAATLTVVVTNFRYVHQFAIWLTMKNLRVAQQNSSASRIALVEVIWRSFLDASTVALLNVLRIQY